MRALTFQGKRTIACSDVVEPRIEKPTDAIVRIDLAGLCGSDLHVYHERERGLDASTVMGHEFVGEVVELGSEPGALRVGQQVLSPFSSSCGACFFCEKGLTARCERGELFGWVEGGVGLQGAQAEAVRVPLASSTLVPLPAGVSEEQGLLLGDVLSTGYYCALRAGVVPGGVYAVLGCGPVGLMAVNAALELGAERVFAIDSVSERLKLARRYGAEPVDRGLVDAAALVREQTGGRGVDAVLEAVGSPGSSRLAMDLVRVGGTLSIVGVHTAPSFSFSPVEAYDKNLSLSVGRCPARAVLSGLFPLVLSGARDLTAIITHRLPLEDGPAAYELFDAKREGCIKVVLRP